MSKITEIIPAQAFEIIRDRIAEILIDEFNTQSILTQNEDLEVNVFVERFFSFENTELPAINVSLAKGSYGNKTQQKTDGAYVYNIDFYSSAASTSLEQGDSISAVKLQRLIGIARAILENPVYRTLGFQPPFIMTTGLSELNIATPDTKQNIDFVSMGRLTFSVSAVETVELKSVNLIDGYDTEVKLGTTNYGYYYTKPQ